MTAEPVVVIGAGPAGLTAAIELLRLGRQVVVVEESHAVGGLSRTVEHDGWRFDIGGHRFYTKVAEIEALWHAWLGPDDFVRRSRVSRIYYRGRWFDYPLRIRNVLANVGPLESVRCLASYGAARFLRHDRSTFEGWVSARFGRRLYEMFFRSYTEKVWGVPARDLPADWAAQRIKTLSLGRAILDSIGIGRGSVTSLVESFWYPRLGPGMMWEAVRDLVTARGGLVELGQRVTAVERSESGGAVAVETVDDAGVIRRRVCSDVVSSMPLGQLAAALDCPPDIAATAVRLTHRDFLTVALVVPFDVGFPDNWIYIHDPEVRVARVQNYGRWSPDLVVAGSTCLGLEYFVNEDDELWQSPDGALIELAAAELVSLGLVAAADVHDGAVIRQRRAYPVYHRGYADDVASIRQWLEAVAPNVWPVGRNGMHRYNNQDHSMLTALVAARRIAGTTILDPWSVSVDDGYGEQSFSRRSAPHLDRARTPDR